MSDKKAATAKPAKAVTVASEPDKKRDELLASVFVGPLLGAAAVITELRSSSKLDIAAVTAELKTQQDAVLTGDLTRAEAMLATQAHTLDTLFNTLAQRAALNMGQHLNAVEAYLRLALKAQSQCRATLEALAAIKNPPVVYAQQANISHGHQQINNGVPAGPDNARPASALKPGSGAGNAPVSNELLEADHGNRLDGGAAGTAGRADQGMEAVGAVNRA